MRWYDEVRRSIYNAERNNTDTNYITVNHEDNASITIFDALDGEFSARRYTIRDPLFIDRSYVNFLVRVSDDVQSLPYTVNRDQLVTYISNHVDKNMLSTVHRILVVTGDEEDTDSLFKDTMVKDIIFEGAHDFPNENQVGLTWWDEDVVCVNMKGLINIYNQITPEEERSTEDISRHIAVTLVHEFRHCAQRNRYMELEDYSCIDDKSDISQDEVEELDAENYAREWVDTHPMVNFVRDNMMDKTKLDSIIDNLWVYDIEVFAHDWMLVAYQPGQDKFVQFHNDSNGVRKWLEDQKVNGELAFLAGFNNKSYDDYILLGIVKGNSPEVIKEHNDFIIKSRQQSSYGSHRRTNPWEHYSIQGRFDRTWNYFRSMDVFHDLPVNMSLKRIQGNMGENIMESPIPFDLPRKLNKNEVEEVFRYCKNDVEATYRLLQLRKKDIENKLEVASMGSDMNPYVVLGMRKSSLVDTYLMGTSKSLEYPRENEFVYTSPECVQLGEHGKKVLDFYNMIKSEEGYGQSCTLTIDGVETKIGWGGIHGARKNYKAESTPDRKIVDIDVSSYYPSLMLQYGYFSKALPRDGKKRFKTVYENRIANKRKGINDKAGAQKLILNTAFGCTKDKYKKMYHPQTANNICITGQLLLIDLMEKLEKSVPSFELIQANTDGVMLSYNPREEKLLQKIVTEWEKRTGMGMEYVDVNKIVQKDVNNYVGVLGETYVVERNKKKVLKENENTEVRRGEWVRNKPKEEAALEFPIVKDAIVKKLLYDIPVEQTIRECNDIHQFQMVTVSVRGAVGAVSYKDDIGTEVQRVNRIYASNDHSYGQVYWTMPLGMNGRVVTGCPEHAVVDNENKLTIQDIDKDWYVKLANERINKFVVEKEVKKEAKKEVKNTVMENSMVSLFDEQEHKPKGR